jgi:hypothetical protein
MTNETNAKENLANGDVAIPVVDLAVQALTPIPVSGEGEVTYLQTEEEIGGDEPGTHDVDVHLTVDVTKH